MTLEEVMGYQPNLQNFDEASKGNSKITKPNSNICLHNQLVQYSWFTENTLNLKTLDATFVGFNLNQFNNKKNF